MLHGGGWCHEGECQDKAVPRVLGGWNSQSCAANPLFCDFGQFEVLYCDLSSYESSQADNANNLGLSYQGEEVLRAGLDVSLDKILEVHGSGYSGLFVLNGGSAGALGAILNSRTVLELVLAKLPNARVKLIAFSPVFFDLGPDSEGRGDALAEYHTNVHDFHGIDPLESCVFARTPISDDWKCWRTENAITEVPKEMPWLVTYSSLDEWAFSRIFLNQMKWCMLSSMDSLDSDPRDTCIPRGVCGEDVCDFASSPQGLSNFDAEMAAKAAVIRQNALDAGAGPGHAIYFKQAPHVAEWADWGWKNIELHPNIAAQAWNNTKLDQYACRFELTA